MWNKMIQPSGDFVIIVEAANPYYAWMAGALQSAIHTWLELNLDTIPEAKAARDVLEQAEKGNPFVGLPPYMEPNLSSWQSLLARGT